MAVNDILYGLVSTLENRSGKTIRIDERNANLAYFGVAENEYGADDEKWLVIRIIRVASEYTVEVAPGQSYNNAWSNRDNINFTPVNVTNVFSLLFDGTNEVVTFGDNFDFGPAQAFSISFWVKANNFAANRCIFGKATNDTNVFGYNAVLNTSGSLQWQMRASGTLRQHTFTGTLNAATWYHLVITYAGGSNINGSNLYIDGVVQNTPAAGSLNDWNHADDFTVGARNVSGGFSFSGNIDEVSVWNKELSQAEVTEIYNFASPSDLTLHSALANLQSWWRMGDGDTFPTILDQIGSIDGTMTNMESGDIVTDVP